MTKQSAHVQIMPALGGYGLSLRGAVAMDIIKHCALVTGQDDGEDSAGRSRIKLMAAADVAKRANDIADILVSDWEQRGWVEVLSSGQADAIFEQQELVKANVADLVWDRKREKRSST